MAWAGGNGGWRGRRLGAGHGRGGWPVELGRGGERGRGQFAVALVGAEVFEEGVGGGEGGEKEGVATRDARASSLFARSAGCIEHIK